MYADVIIDISHEQLDKTFQYAVPDELVDVIELGTVSYTHLTLPTKLEV